MNQRNERTVRRVYRKRRRKFRPNIQFWIMIAFVCLIIFLLIVLIPRKGQNHSSETLEAPGEVLQNIARDKEDAQTPDELTRNASPEATLLDAKDMSLEASGIASEKPLNAEASELDSKAKTLDVNDANPEAEASADKEPLAKEALEPGSEAKASAADESPDNEASGNGIVEPRTEASSETELSEWYLILVNREHPIPADYPINLITLSNGTRVDERIYPDLQAMFDEARSLGMALFVRDGYRTQEEQQEIFDEKVMAYMTEGYSEAEAIEMTSDWVSLPGTSEHQLGLAVDINPDMTISTVDEVYDWLYQNAWRYGFIKRYPEDKTEITGISNEPWHYRYVGYEAAASMQESGLCLEEYLATLGET